MTLERIDFLIKHFHDKSLYLSKVQDQHLQYWTRTDLKTFNRLKDIFTEISTLTDTFDDDIMMLDKRVKQLLTIRRGILNEL